MSNNSDAMHIHINPEIRERAMPILDELSISIGEYFNMALSQLVQQHRIPFESEIDNGVYNSFMRNFARDIAETHAAVAEGSAKIYSSTAEMFAEWDKEDAEDNE